MRHAGIGRGWIKQRAVGHARANPFGYDVVDFEDDALGVVLAVLLLVLALDDGEGLHDVVYIVASNAVEVKVGSVELAPQQEAPLLPCDMSGPSCRSTLF